MIKISFLGGAQEVTGANYLLEIGQKKILVDCGLFQGTKVAEDKNRERFSYDPKQIDILFVTHAHLDHVGRIPKLVREGFKGKIISTPPTRDFGLLMLDDSLDILTKEAVRDKEEPIYNRQDLERTASLWEVLEYNKEFVFDGFKVVFREAGHILGSAMIEFVIDGKKIVFTGDLGNPPMPLLREPYKITDADYLIIESTYGDKEHEDEKGRRMKIERAIEKTILNKGVLMIPAFSMERTQQLLYEINNLVENGRIPRVPIFLDSPLAIKATGIYGKYENYYNKEAKFIISSGDDIFKFPGLKFCLTTEESKQINGLPPPKVIIAGSGMSTGGRIVHHEKRYLSDSDNILLIVGFQSAGSLGRQLVEGAKTVKIFGEKIPVKAEVISVRGYSAHPDMNSLFAFVKNTSETLKKVFVAQGEAQAALFFTQRIRDYLCKDAVAPRVGDTFELS